MWQKKRSTRRETYLKYDCSLSFVTQLHYRLYLYDSDFMRLYNVLVKASLCLTGRHGSETCVSVYRDAESSKLLVGEQENKLVIESKTHLAQ